MQRRLLCPGCMRHASCGSAKHIALHARPARARPVPMTPPARARGGQAPAGRAREGACQTELHAPPPRGPVPAHEWSVWALRWRALDAANLRVRAMRSAQTAATAGRCAAQTQARLPGPGRGAAGAAGGGGGAGPGRARRPRCPAGCRRATGASGGRPVRGLRYGVGCSRCGRPAVLPLHIQVRVRQSGQVLAGRGYVEKDMVCMGCAQSARRCACAPAATLPATGMLNAKGKPVVERARG